MELTVTINNIQIPERAAMILAPDRAIGTEFQLSSSRIVVVKDIAPTTPVNVSAVSNLKANSSVIIPFPYESSVQYSVHLEQSASPQGSNIICKADCTPVPANSGWYYSTSALLYSSGGVYNANSPCPSAVCGSFQSYIAFDPTHVFGTGAKYWRSPSLFTIAANP